MKRFLLAAIIAVGLSGCTTMTSLDNAATEINNTAQKSAVIAPQAAQAAQTIVVGAFNVASDLFHATIGLITATKTIAELF
jgi:uncharacterized protein YceK